MTLLSFAFGAGVLATVNPCGFAMLPGFLAFYLGDDQEPRQLDGAGRLANGLAVGGAVSVGFAAVFVTAGLIVSAGLRSLMRYVPWAAAVIGAALVIIGVVMLAGRHVGLRVLDRIRPGRDGGWRAMVAYGAAYAIASLSCTLAVLLAVIAQALATHNPLQMLGVFGAYSAGSATILTALAVSASFAKAGLARGVKRLLPLAGRLGGAVLVASGVYLVSYWLPALRSGSGRGRAAVSLPDRLSSQLTALLDGHTGLFALIAAVLAAAGLASAVAWHRRLPDAGDGDEPAGSEHRTAHASADLQR